MAICVTLAIKQLYKTFLEYFDTRQLYGNVFLRFCIVLTNELVVLDSLENNKQYKNAGERFRVYWA